MSAVRASQLLLESDLWDEIRSQSKRSKELLAMVGYLGRHPDAVISWPRTSTVICDLTPETVKSGASSARGALDLHHRGVAVRSLPSLHAKIYIFDHVAIVSSANLSQTSSRLIEAGVLVTDSHAVRELRAYAARLKTSALPLNDDRVLAELIKLEPQRRTKLVRGIHRPAAAKPMPFDATDRVWLVPVYWDKETTRAEETAKRKIATGLAREQRTDSDEIDWINEVSEETKTALTPYSYIYFWYPPRGNATRATHGWLEGPWQTIAGIDLGQRFGSRRFSVAVADRNSRVIRVDDKAAGVLGRIIGRRIVSDTWDTLYRRDAPVGLSARQVNTLIRFVHDKHGRR